MRAISLRAGACLALLLIPVAGSTAASPSRTVRVAGADLEELGFERLSSFPYTVVDAGTGATPAQIEQARKTSQVPDWLRAYHNKRVVLTGYMLPLQLENGLTKKLILMRDITTCCYGATPNMNDYVVVTMKGEGIKAVQDIPVVIAGVLRVGEKYEGGYLVSIFDFEGEKFLGPRK